MSCTHVRHYGPIVLDSPIMSHVGPNGPISALKTRNEENAVACTGQILLKCKLHT